MSLGVGARLGHYAVTTKIGEGGMGEVWQATDTKLNRQVALKILPGAFASDPDRLARFQREAQVLASLNGPPTNTVAIFRLTATGSRMSQGTRGSRRCICRPFPNPRDGTWSRRMAEQTRCGRATARSCSTARADRCGPSPWTSSQRCRLGRRHLCSSGAMVSRCGSTCSMTESSSWLGRILTRGPTSFRSCSTGWRSSSASRLSTDASSTRHNPRPVCRHRQDRRGRHGVGVSRTGYEVGTAPEYRGGPGGLLLSLSAPGD